MLVMNQNGMNRLLSDKFTIGGEAAAAAGPVGRETSANTDALLHAEILSWSRSRGLFAGLSLEGTTLRPDGDENLKLYGRNITNKEILGTDITPLTELARSSQRSTNIRGQGPALLRAQRGSPSQKRAAA